MDPTNWLPTYPDVLPRRRVPRGPTLASQPPYNAAIFPVVDVLAGLTFLPSYPDRVPHLRTPREDDSTATGPLTFLTIGPLAWLPAFPHQVPHRRLAIASMPGPAAPPPGVVVVVAQSLTWLARFPDRVYHTRAPKPAGAFWAIDPSIPAAGEPCVDLALDTCTTPTLLAQAVTTPTLIEEGLGSAALLDEDLCP